MQNIFHRQKFYWTAVLQSYFHVVSCTIKELVPKRGKNEKMEAHRTADLPSQQIQPLGGFGVSSLTFPLITHQT